VHYRGGYDFAGLVERARELRKKQTPAETIFWEMVRDRQFLGLKFRRQHQLGDYIADFYCPEHKLVIEFDGSVHATTRKRDHKRDAWMEAQGFKVLRFKNDQLFDAPESVLAAMAQAVHQEDAFPLPVGEGQGEAFPLPARKGLGGAFPLPLGEGEGEGSVEELDRLFPDSFQDSELGEIPKGWKVATIGEHMVNFDSQRIPVSGAVRAKRQGPYPYHGAAGVMDHVDDYLFDGIYLLVGEDGSVVHDSGLAVTQYVWGKILVNNHAHVLQGRGAVSTEQLCMYFRFEPVTPYVTGAVQPKLSQGRMNMMPFTFGGDDVCRAFAEAVQPWFSRVRAATDESRTLASLRDALLPKLISGELRVKDMKEFIGRTV
jgi:type I restriction enzyme S subunit